VWLACNKSNKTECAVKQISKKGNTLFTSNNLSIAKNEIDILTSLTNTASLYPSNNVIKIYSSYEDKNDIWFSFEKGGKSLSSLSYKIKGSFLKSERIYTIQKGEFIKHLFSNIKHFKYLITQLLTGLNFIHNEGIIHADIKPENILIEYTTVPSFTITNVKIIDFGSAFYASNPSNINSNTPEYLSPEMTEVVEGKNKKTFLKDLIKYNSCIDMWSLGITLLELIIMCPVWMSYKAEVIINGKRSFGFGLFGFKGRDCKKIHQKQREVVSGLKGIVDRSIMGIFPDDERDKFVDLLSKMLNVNYKERITPQDALQHCFLK
jgi:serine/threonine protein kinase